MSRIIENQLIRFHTIDLNDDDSVVDYLKNTNTKFVLQHIDNNQFEKLSTNGSIDMLDKSCRYIASYNCDDMESGIKNAVELSDERKRIVGSFAIRDNEIIYLPTGSYFTHESNPRGESGTTYYTTMTMVDLLQNSIRTRNLRYKDLECLIYIGLNNHNKAIFQTSNEEELFMYATNREKGVELVKEIQSKRRLK